MFFPSYYCPLRFFVSPQCTKQILSEKLGRGSRTVDLELEAQIEILRDNKRKYEHVIKLAQTLCTQLAQMLQTQRQLGDAFADLSLKTPELHVSTLVILYKIRIGVYLKWILRILYAFFPTVESYFAL